LEANDGIVVNAGVEGGAAAGIGDAKGPVAGRGPIPYDVRVSLPQSLAHRVAGDGDGATGKEHSGTDTKSRILGF
jgi:hypothetical protein